MHLLWSPRHGHVTEAPRRRRGPSSTGTDSSLPPHALPLLCEASHTCSECATTSETARTRARGEVRSWAPLPRPAALRAGAGHGAGHGALQGLTAGTDHVRPLRHGDGAANAPSLGKVGGPSPKQD